MSDRLEIDSDEAREHAAAPASPRRPIKSVLLFIAVMGLAGGSWWAYRTDAPRSPPSEVPVIHSDAAPVKEAPRDPGGMIVPGQDSVLLNREGKSNPRVEQLLPDPEQAIPRPAAPAKQALPIETSTVPSKAAMPPAIGAPAALPAAPQNPIAAAPPAAPAAPPAVIAQPSPAVITPPVATNVPTPTVSGPGYRLQLGAVRSEEAAKQEWQRLQRAQPDILGKLTLATARVDLGEKGIFYRIQAGPIADEAAAAQSCTALKSRNVGCILVKP